MLIRAQAKKAALELTPLAKGKPGFVQWNIEDSQPFSDLLRSRLASAVLSLSLFERSTPAHGDA